MCGGEDRASPDLLLIVRGTGWTRGNNTRVHVHTHTHTHTHRLCICHLEEMQWTHQGSMGFWVISRCGSRTTNHSLKEAGTPKQGGWPKALGPPFLHSPPQGRGVRVRREKQEAEVPRPWRPGLGKGVERRREPATLPPLFSGCLLPSSLDPRGSEGRPGSQPC